MSKQLFILCLTATTIFAGATFSPAASLDFVANFATGELQFVNNDNAAVNLTAYDLRSASGTLLPGGWLSISDNYDLSGDGSVDSNDNWIKLVQTSTNLFEGEDAGDGGLVLPGQTVSLGLAWNPTIGQDLSIDYLDGNEQVVVTPDYRSFAADFNSDLRVDVIDLSIWRSGFGLRSGASVSNGDADRDGDVDADDFYVWSGQLGSVSPFFSSPAVVAAANVVPEPNSALLLLVSLSAGLISRCRR